MKYRKKPVVIEAMQVVDDISLAAISGWMTGNNFVDFRIVGVKRPYGIEINTLEGVMLATPGDWIIRGTQGEFYPCKPDVFLDVYEPVE